MGSSRQRNSINKFFQKAVDLTSGEGNAAGRLENALLVAAGAALDIRSVNRENLGSVITGQALGMDTLHHFFANAFNNLESPVIGRVATFVGNQRDPEPLDRNANSLGARFGQRLAEFLAPPSKNSTGAADALRPRPSSVITSPPPQP